MSPQLVCDEDIINDGFDERIDGYRPSFKR